MRATCNELQLGCEGSSYQATEKNEIQASSANTICVRSINECKMTKILSQEKKMKIYHKIKLNPCRNM